MGASLGQKHFPTISSLPTPVQGQKHSAKVIQSRHEQWNELNTLSPALGTAAADGHRALLGGVGTLCEAQPCAVLLGDACSAPRRRHRTDRHNPTWEQRGRVAFGEVCGKGRAPRRCRKLGTEPRGHNPVPASSSRGDVHSLQRVPAGPAARVPYGAAPSRHGHEWCKTPNAAPPPSELSRAPGLCPHACPPPSAQ